MKTKHWSKVTLLHEVVTNPNITIKGKHSYYSDCWDAGFEESVVRYLQGDEFSRDWEPKWKIDKLHIGDFVCIAAEVVIVMGEIVHIERVGSPCTHLWTLLKKRMSGKEILTLAMAPGSVCDP